mmetsp:Transcript_745/g.1810  ORF Transcript_745/g.1810 Transcript_745/m.1810 type:complete len:105 (-) Transcript_745:1961-2275(-)
MKSSEGAIVNVLGAAKASNASAADQQPFDHEPDKTVLPSGLPSAPGVSPVIESRCCQHTRIFPCGFCKDPASRMNQSHLIDLYKRLTNVTEAWYPTDPSIRKHA